ncbi:MAG: tRNA lysidine(34) synthetase TilS, partial [Bacillati bacterium ANGP1]
HTLDDQAETVLMRLLRGSGLEGLAGIPPVRTGGGVRIIRPLIEAGRAEVLAYLGAVGTGWREDETNRDVAMLRNRVRLVLLPALEGYNPDIRQALARLAGLLRDEAEALKLL